MNETEITVKGLTFKLRLEGTYISVKTPKIDYHCTHNVCSFFSIIGIDNYYKYLARLYGYTPEEGCWPSWKHSDKDMGEKVMNNIVGLVEKANGVKVSLEPKTCSTEKPSSEADSNNNSLLLI